MMKGRVFKRGKTWSIDVLLSKDNRKQKGGFRTKKEAEDYTRELINKHERGEYAKYENLTVEELLELWLQEHCKHNLKPSTYAVRELMIRSRIIPGIGKMKVEELKPIHFKKFYNKMHDEGLSAGYIHTMHSCLRTVFRHAVKWQVASKYVMEHVDAPKLVRSNQLQTWTLEEAVKFLAYTSSLNNEYRHIAYVLAIFTGMRRGEILGLRWSDIDFEKKTLQVMQAVYKVVGESPSISSTKTAGSVRSITLPDNVIDELKSHKAKQNEIILKFGKAYQKNNLVVPRPDGSPMDPRGLNKHFDSCIQRAGMNKIRFHDLRHTHATIMLRLGEHPKVVSERLGHSNVNITLNTYSHVLPNMQEDAARKLFEAFKDASK